MTTRTPPPVRNGSAFMLRSLEAPSRWLVVDHSKAQADLPVRASPNPDGSSFIVTQQRPSPERPLLSGDPIWLNQACGQSHYLFAGADARLVAKNDKSSTFALTKVEIASGQVKPLPDGAVIYAGDAILIRDTATNHWLRISPAGEPITLTRDAKLASPFGIDGYLEFVTFEKTFQSTTAWNEKRSQGFQELLVPEERLICYVTATEEIKSHGNWRLAGVSANRVMVWLESVGSQMPAKQWGGEVRVKISAVTVPASTPQAQVRALRSQVEL